MIITFWQKNCDLPIPLGIARWVVDFQSDRKQRVKLANDCYSEWGHVPSGVLQGTKLETMAFSVNYSFDDDVDDTSIAETVQKGNSTIQSDAELVQNWSRENKL